MIQNRVIAEFRIELDRAKQPGYVSRYDDDYDDDIDAATLLPPEEKRPTAPQMPPGTHLQPAQLQPPAPHILPAPQSAPGPTTSSGSVGGPHFLNPAAREGKEAKEAAHEAEDKSKPDRGDFGAGIF